MGFFSRIFGDSGEPSSKIGDAPTAEPRPGPAAPVAADSPDTVRVSALDGLMPNDRQRFADALATGVSRPRILLANCHGIDPDLVELVEFDLVELCADMGFPFAPVIVRQD